MQWPGQAKGGDVLSIHFCSNNHSVPSLRMMYIKFAFPGRCEFLPARLWVHHFCCPSQQLMNGMSESMRWWTQQALWSQMESGLGFSFSHYSCASWTWRWTTQSPLKERLIVQLFGVLVTAGFPSLVPSRLPQLHRAASPKSWLSKGGPHPWLIEVGAPMQDNFDWPFQRHSFGESVWSCQACIPAQLLPLPSPESFPPLGHWSEGRSLLNTQLCFICASWKTKLQHRINLA